MRPSGEKLGERCVPTCLETGRDKPSFWRVQCVQLNWQFTDAQGRLWRNGFHRTRDLPNQQGTSFAVVTRNLDHTWSVEPSAASCQAGNAAGVARTFLVESAKGRSVFTDYGEFWLPFRLTLASLD